MEWISINESAPEYNELCLCICDDGPDNSTIAGFYESGRVFNDATGCSWRVKWWCPIPDEIKYFQP